MKTEITNINYAARISVIKTITKHPNADKLFLTTINGDTAITNADYKEGDVVVKFPLECTINKAFLRKENAFEETILNEDTEKKGYFNKHGRVRAIKLRGVFCGCYIHPIKEFNDFFGTSFTAEDEGLEFNKLNDISVAEKYVPNSNKTKGTNLGTKKERRSNIDLIKDGQFRFHWDTSHFGRNLHKIEANDVVSITNKVHGCLPGFQTITMHDGLCKKIKDIKKGDIVKGFDHTTKKVVNTEVLDTYTNGNTDYWIKIKKSCKTHKSGKFKKCLYLTEDHKIFLKDKGYTQAKDCNVGDIMISNYIDYEDNAYLKSIITGLLLGDGSVDISNTSYAISFSHKQEHIEYLEYLRYILNNFITESIDKKISGYGTFMARSRTKGSQLINKLTNGWLNNGHKIIPNNFTLDPISLSIWYMDDGNLAHTDFQKDRALFAICRYDDESCNNLEKALTAYGFSNFTFFKSEGYNRLRLNASDAEILFEDIKHLIPECMQYKLPVSKRGFFKKPEQITFKKTDHFQYSEITSLEKLHKNKVKKYSTKHDIRTTTSNFFSGDILLHNSSLIVSHVLVNKKLSIVEKIAKFLGANIKEHEYGIIAASRKVIKSVSNESLHTHGHYYGEDIWQLASESIKDKVDKGITLYGEIVGYTPSGSFIQKGYDYGHTPPKECIWDEKYNEWCEGYNYSIFIYRITYTTPDGNVIEFDWNMIKEYCLNKGLKHVEEIYHGKAKDFIENCEENEVSEKIFAKIKQDIEKKCYLCTTGVPMEGYVIRRESRGVDPFKVKSEAFLLYEGKELDSGEVSLEDEN